MGIRLLGPLEVDGSRRLEPRDRVVLAVLAVRRGQVVAPGQIAEAVWGDDPPASWAKQVQICVARLRKAVGHETIETVDRGYRLRVGDEEVDADRFARLLERASFLRATGDADGAAASYGTALSLWRGDPLDDLDGWDLASTEINRYQELRRTAEDGWLDARLAAGDHWAVATEAAAMAEAEPLRERRWAILALALYRCSRQAEALRALVRARRLLRDQIGVDPGPELTSLEGAILDQDPALNAPSRSDASVAICPYKGLAHYDEADADDFFGRESETAACLARFDTTPLLVIAGPSGSGKSSLVRAGVVPALRGCGRKVVVVVPGPDPVAAIMAQLAPAQPGVVVVIDQFEELYALGSESAAVEEVAGALVEYVEHGGHVILCVRSDHLGSLGTTRELRRLAEGGLHLVGPLAGDDLRAAISGPASRGGLRLESGLVEVLLRDCGRESGGLPLLSHALVEAWKRRDGNTLTVAGYRESGGIQGAVAHTAERLYERLSIEQRETLRSILLRLVTPSATGDPIRCARSSRSLLGTPEREQVTAMLVRERLVTAHDDSFDLSHEALIRAWPRLRAWLDDDVNGQRILRHLVMAAEGWASLGYAEGELYRGARLETALEWQATSSPELTDVETAFLEASRAQDLAERRELAIRADREGRQNRRLRGLVAVIGGLLVLSVVVVSIAVDQAERSRSASRAATTRSLAAASLANVESDPELSMLLALAALERSGPDPGPERWAAENALHRALTAARLERRVPGVGERVDWSARGDVLAAFGPIGTGTVEIRDARTGDRLRTIAVGSSDPTDLAFAPAGDLLAVTTLDGSVRVVDPASGTTVRTMVGDGGSRSVGPSFSADGALLAAAWPEERGGVVRVLSVPAGQVRLLASMPGASRTALSPAGTRLVVALEGDSTARVIDATTGEPQLGLANEPAGPGVGDVAWSPDGRSIATAHGGSAAVFDAASGSRRLVISDHRSVVSAIAWDPDSLRLATASADGTVQISAIAEGGPRALVTLSGRDNAKGVTDLAFSPDGSRLVTGERSRASTIVWDVGVDGGAEVANLTAAAYAWNSARFSDDGRYLFTTGARGSVRVWDAATLNPIRTLGGGQTTPLAASMTPGVPIAGPGHVTHIAATPDGDLVATLDDQGRTSGQGRVPVWDVAAGVKRFTARVGSFANYAEWTPDGEVLAIAGGEGDHGSITMVDRAGRTIATIATPGLLVGSLAFTEDGARLVTTVEALGPTYDPAAGRVVVWDWRTGTELRTIETESWFAIPGPVEGLVVTAPHQEAASQDVTVWNLDTGEPVTTLAGHSGAVNTLAVDRATAQVATAGNDGTVGIWDGITGERRLVLRGHLGSVTFVSLSSDGSRLASVGLDGVVRVWALDRTELVRIAEDRLTRHPTDDECREFPHLVQCP